MKPTYLVLSCLVVSAGCGTTAHPEYTVHGVEIYGDTYTPPRAEFLQNLDVMFEVLTEWTGLSDKELTRQFKELVYIEFVDEPLYVTTDRKAAGLYWVGVHIIQVWVKDGQCLANTAWAHEMLHLYSEVWGLPLDHSVEELWDRPNGLEPTIYRATREATCEKEKAL